MTQDSNIKLFKLYLTTFGFSGDVLSSEFLSLSKSPEAAEFEINRKSLNMFRVWLHAPSSSDIVQNILNNHSSEIEAIREDRKARWDDYRDSLKPKLLTLENVSNFVGMFDEG